MKSSKNTAKRLFRSQPPAARITASLTTVPGASADQPGTDIVCRDYKHGSCRTMFYCHPTLAVLIRRMLKTGGLADLVVDEEVYRACPRC
jgi:hypothetical protein